MCQITPQVTNGNADCDHMGLIRTFVLRDMRASYASMGYPIPACVDEALACDRDWSDVAYLLAMHDAHGPSVAHAVSRRTTAVSKWPGVFAALEGQALRLLGRRPQAMMRFYPGAYSMAMRDVGTVVYADCVNGGRMDFSGMPHALAAHAGFRAGMRGALEGLLERLGWCGQVSEAASATSISFTMRWWRPATIPSHASRAPSTT